MKIMRRKLHTRIFVYSMLISYIPLLVLGVLSYQSQRRVIEQEIQASLTNYTTNLSKELYSYLNERVTDLQYLSKNTILTNKVSTINEINEELSIFLHQHPDFYGTIMLDSSGKVIADPDYKMVGKNLSERIWFKAAMNKDLFLSDIYLSPVVKRPILAMGVPIVSKNGGIIGVISPSFDLERFWKKIDEYVAINNGHKRWKVSIFNKQGIVVADHDRSSILHKNFLNSEKITLSKVKHSISNKELFNGQKKSQVFSAAIIPKVKGTESDWYVVASADKLMLYKPLNELLRTYILIFTIVAFIIFIVAMRLSRSIVEPVTNLVDSVEKYVQDGTFPKLPKRTYEEMDTLNTTFSEMAVALDEREKEIIRTSQLKYVGQLAAGLAHEIRNPITTIRGFFQLFKENKNESAFAEQHLTIMIEEIDRVNNIINDLLYLAKPYQLHIHPYNLNEVVNEIILFYSKEFEKKKIDIIPNCCDIPNVLIDKGRFRQVLINVFKNAMEAMNEGGTLIISAESLENNVVLTIEDTGDGISQEELDKIGTPFYTTKVGGTGLGMAITFQIITELKGSITIDSKKNIGTKIIIKLPTNQRLQ